MVKISAARLGILLALCCCCHAEAGEKDIKQSSVGTDVYVSPVGVDALDRDGSIGAPWRTIGFAMDMAGQFATASSSITIYLLPWRYEERVVFQPHVRLRGADPANPESTKIVPPAEAPGADKFVAITGAEDTALADLTVELQAEGPADAVLLVIDNVRMDVRNVRLDGHGAVGALGVRVSGEGSSSSLLSACVLERLVDGARVTGSELNITGNVFQDIAQNAVEVVAPAARAASSSATPLLGDIHRLRETGQNCFRGIGGQFVSNESASVVQAHACNWAGLDTEDAIRARMTGEVDFVPFLRGPTVLAAAIATSVNDAANLAPIEGATVYLNPGLLDPVTQNWEGVYFFTPLLPSAYAVRVEAPGYEPQTLTGIQAPAGGVAAVQVWLESAGGEGEGEEVPLSETAEALLADFDQLDADDNGALTYEEAAAGAVPLTPDRFQVLDASGDGQLTAAELHEAAGGESFLNCRFLDNLGLKM